MFMYFLEHSLYYDFNYIYFYVFSENIIGP